MWRMNSRHAEQKVHRLATAPSVPPKHKEYILLNHYSNINSHRNNLQNPTYISCSI